MARRHRVEPAAPPGPACQRSKFSPHRAEPFPDVVHELVGHATSFFDPDIVRLSRLFGEAALAADAEGVVELERVYWYTLEFGVASEEGEVKAYGAGLLSSFGELGAFRDRTRLEPFDIDRIVRTPYDPTSYQKVLFVAESFREMVRRVGGWLEERLQSGADGRVSSDSPPGPRRSI